MARSNNQDVFVFDAVRTPRGKGKPGGGLAGAEPVELVKQLVDALVRRNGNVVRNIDHLSLGCVGQVGAQGGHIALISKLYSGLPETASAWSLNNYCTSGLSAITGVVDKIASGNAEFAMAGGVESMSHVPFLADKATYYTDPAFATAMRYVPVAVSADVLAYRENVTRQELDDVAVDSHRRAGTAQKNNLGLRSLITVVDDDGKPVLDRDEYVRADTTAEGLKRFESAFGPLAEVYAPVLKSALGIENMDCRHAVVHAPGVADGAGLALLGTRDGGDQRGLKPQARVVGYAEAGGDPVLSLTAGTTAMDRVLQKTGISLSDIDVIEYMEAFAVVPALFRRRHPTVQDKVNIFGGHIARGHALGATGAVLTSTLLDVMQEKESQLGLLVCFAASGIGSAIILERTR